MHADERLVARQAREPRAGDRPDQPLLALQRAGQRMDHVAVVGSIRFGVRRTSDAEDVAEVLHYRVLKPAARAEKRHVVLPRPSNRLVRGRVVGVWRARDEPDAVEPAQIPNPLAAGRHPLRRHVLAEQPPDRIELAMARVVRLAVADQGDGHAHGRQA